MEDFKGKTVIVTGSSDGIGRAAAVEFASRGANVLVHGRDQQRIADTLKLCKDVASDQAKFKFAVVQGDITDENVIDNIVKTAVAELGRIDVLVNNAGAGGEGSLIDGDIAGLDRQINLLLRAPILLSQRCFPELKKTGGNILNISSGAAVRPRDIGPFYCIAKAGLNMFSQCGALEFGAQGVRVNALCPGYVQTPIFERILEKKEGVAPSKERLEEYMKPMTEVTPLGKIGTVEEVAKMIAFLTSDAATMMNGACIVHDGGATLTGLDVKTILNASK